MEQGLLHLYWGDGKGKTTAAMGLALRALGSGKRVVIVQFLKSGNSGEIPLLAQLGAEIYRGKAGQKFADSGFGHLFAVWLRHHRYDLPASGRGYSAGDIRSRQ